MLHRAAIYWLDLDSDGWFGRDGNASMAAITDAIWSNASHVLEQWRGMLASAPMQMQVLPPAEVVLFVDELSAAARPLLGRGGTIASGYPFETALLQAPWQDLAGCGAPVKVHLLSDILLPSFDAKAIKLAVFLNAVMLGPEVRAAIKSKLRGAGQVQAWVYAAGILDAPSCTAKQPTNSDSDKEHTTPNGVGGHGNGNVDATAGCTPNMATAGDLVGMKLTMSTDDATVLQSTFVKKQHQHEQQHQHQQQQAPPMLPPALLGTSYGQGLGVVSPRLACTGAVVLARYSNNEPSMCWSHQATTNFSSVFIGTPR
jgi:hypothetical protein